MAGFWGAKADSSRQASSSVPASIAGVGRSFKRKREGDDVGSPLILASDSESSKRQKHGIGCYDASAIGRGGEDVGSRRGYQPALDIRSIKKISKLCSSHKRHEPSTKCPFNLADEAVPSEVPDNPRTAPTDTLSVLDRKRYFIYTPDDGMKKRMHNSVYSTYKLFDDSRSKDDCWLHPSPPPARKNGNPMGTINRYFVWRDLSGKHRLSVNFGLVALIIKHHLTKEQMEGYMNKGWHLSHLCGNWTCCNWRHMTVECGRMNIGRNGCFPKAERCQHDPACMKERKRRLLVTLEISDLIKRALESTRNGVNPATICQISTRTADVFDCGICGQDVWCFGDHRICRSLTSIAKSQEALEKLELCSEPSDEILEAIAYLKQIVEDLIREKTANDAVTLQRELDWPMGWDHHSFSE